MGFDRRASNRASTSARSHTNQLLRSCNCKGASASPQQPDGPLARSIVPSVPQAGITLPPRGPDPQGRGSVDDDGLCPKPAYLQAPWIIGKRAFETDYCASLPGTA